ncbi:hypothetical protein HanRHA438_Chr09g0418341 [Helianthus annuus]|nr:hypothetical protein HanRHA438_Chr09g0418341 [Helianthus annuus]
MVLVLTRVHGEMKYLMTWHPFELLFEVKQWLREPVVDCVHTAGGVGGFDQVAGIMMGWWWSGRVRRIGIETLVLLWCSGQLR